MLKRFKKIIDKNPELKLLFRRINMSNIFDNDVIKKWHYRKALKKINNIENCLPETLHIETTNICNARCIMCGYSDMRRSKGIMDESIFRKIVNDAAHIGIDTINLQFYGEPLLDKDFFKRVEYIKKHAIKVRFNTNGSLLTEDMARKCIESGVDEINVSIDAFDSETYEKIRKGLCYEEVVENIKNFVLLKEKLKVNRPYVRLIYIMFLINARQVHDFIRFWKNKVDEIDVSFMRDWAGQKVQEDSGSIHLGKGIPQKNPCRSLWKDLVVMYDGRVALCCEDYDGVVDLGSLAFQSIEQVWFGGKFQDYRQAHLDDKRDIMKLCRKCRKFSLWV